MKLHTNNIFAVEYDAEYRYFCKDHLGSVRKVLSYDDDWSARWGWYTEYQSNLYSPFGGLEFEDNLAENKTLFTGKELQDSRVGNDILRQYDFGARYYDPTVARWTTIDPLAEKYYSHSPYNYVGNNPISRIDPDGMAWYFDENGNYLGEDGSSDPSIKLVGRDIWDNFRAMLIDFFMDDISPALNYLGKNSIGLASTLLSDGAYVGIFEHFNMTGVPLTSPLDVMGAYGPMTLRPEELMRAAPHIGGLMNKRTGEITQFMNDRSQNLLYLNLNNVKANLMMWENGYNIMSAMRHENRHFLDAAADPMKFYSMKDYEKEYSAIFYGEIFDKDWFKTTPAYRNSVMRYLDKNFKMGINDDMGF